MNKDELKKRILTPQKVTILTSGVLLLFVNGLFSLIFMGIWAWLCMPDIMKYYSEQKKGVTERKPYVPPKEEVKP